MLGQADILRNMRKEPNGAAAASDSSKTEPNSAVNQMLVYWQSSHIGKEPKSQTPSSGCQVSTSVLRATRNGEARDTSLLQMNNVVSVAPKHESMG